jgi:hypothetical protein
MGWIKWVGGGIAASVMAAAILFGVLVTGGGANAEEGSDDDDGALWGAFGLLEEAGLTTGEGEIAVVALAGPNADEWKALVAEKLGVTVEALETAMQEAREELGLPAPGEGRPFRHGVIFGWHLHGAIDAAAKAIGVEPSVITEGLRDGKSIAQIAEENGVSRDAVKTAIVTAVTEKVNEAVSNGRITQERADEILGNLDERVERLLDFVPGDGPFQDFREFREERGQEQ